MPEHERREVAVVIGVGGMGIACARRLGPGRELVLADFKTETLDTATETLGAEGHSVTAQAVDVANAASVGELATVAAGLGPIGPIVHTAGLSPTMVAASQILDVDLLGTAYVLDVFLPHATGRTVAVCIASMAGHMWPMDQETEKRIANAPTGELLEALGVEIDALDPGSAYAIAKRAAIVRVQGMAQAWGARDGRVVSISPGIISTSMGRQELAEQPFMHEMLRMSPVQRMGTPDDIAAAVEWLCSPAASFITGTDLCIDGGVVAAIRSGAP